MVVGLLTIFFYVVVWMVPAPAPSPALVVLWMLVPIMVENEV